MLGAHVYRLAVSLYNVSDHVELNERLPVKEAPTTCVSMVPLQTAADAKDNAHSTAYFGYDSSRCTLEVSMKEARASHPDEVNIGTHRMTNNHPMSDDIAC